MDAQPEELIIEQALLMRYDDIINLCKSNSLFKKTIYHNADFWRNFARINLMNENFHVVVQQNEEEHVQVDVIITIHNSKLLIVIDKADMPRVRQRIESLLQRKTDSINIYDVDSNYYELSLDNDILNIQFYTKYHLNMFTVNIHYTEHVGQQLKKIA